MARETKAETDVDDHWKRVVYCKECKHMEWEGQADMFPIDICDRLKVSHRISGAQTEKRNDDD